MEHHRSELARDIHDGRIRLPIEAEGSALRTALGPLPARAREVELAFGMDPERRYVEMWRRLRVISCWSDGAASFHAERVSALFPHAYVQPKGLLATEGVVSFPLEPAKGSVAAYRSHFFEFLPEGHCTPLLLHQLDEGEVYTVVLTTGGGLYRYNLGDRIGVTARYRGIPVIRFYGRASVSDIVGEKLDEAHVQRVVERVFARYAVKFDFVLFAPELRPEGGCYTLFLEPTGPLPRHKVEAAVRDIDQDLRENFHYAYARDLGQLSDPELVILEGGTGQETFVRRCCQSGQRLGDIKPSFLDRRTGWKEYFLRLPGTVGTRSG
jgi:hypothetical protein